MIKCWAWIWVSERSWFACPELFCHAPNLSSPGWRIRLCRRPCRCRRRCRRRREVLKDCVARCDCVACLGRERFLLRVEFLVIPMNCWLWLFTARSCTRLSLPPHSLCFLVPRPDTASHFWGWKTETESWNCAAPATNWFPQSVGNFQGVVTFQNVSQFSLDPRSTSCHAPSSSVDSLSCKQHACLGFPSHLIAFLLVFYSLLVLLCVWECLSVVCHNKSTVCVSVNMCVCVCRSGSKLASSGLVAMLARFP